MPAREDKVTHDEMADAIRALAMDAVEKAKSGHPGPPMGAADIATVLFTKVLNYDAAAAGWRTAIVSSCLPAMALCCFMRCFM